MQHYAAEIDITDRLTGDDQIDQVMDALAAFAPSIHDNATGSSTITITITATTLGQATTEAVERICALGHQPTAATVMTEAERDAREGTIDLPPLVSGAEAAKRLGLTPGAVTARIREGRLQGVQVGRTWAVPLAAIAAEITRRSN